jgi:hypothetical protein
MEPNDWMCSACSHTNFRKRDTCRSCGTPKNRKLGDRICPNCDDLNFASRTSCRKCNTQLPPNNQPVKPLELNKLRIGDWICPKNDCKELNFASRNKCRKCNSDKITQPIQPTQSNDDNICIICMSDNKTHVITKCGHLCYCGVCGFNINKCPICRVTYNPDTDLLKIFNT